MKKIHASNATSSQKSGLETDKSSSNPVTVKLIDDKPSPLDFDAFIPWVCFNVFEIPQIIVVTRLIQEEYESRNILTKKKIKTSKKMIKQSNRDSTDKSVKSSAAFTDGSSTAMTSNNNHKIKNSLIIINASYDHDRLVDIAIIGCHLSINRGVIQALNLCLPFHPLLTKLSICKGGLNAVVLYEINKMLPHSNITDICFDDCFVAEGNYYIVLEQTSHLRYLSLKRCKINNLICKELATRIDYGRPASKTLLLLDLASNSITDGGARTFGEVFRRNRRLLYINLSGNKITDSGVEGLVKHLLEFPLTADEIIETRRKKFEYLKKKVRVYNTCLENILCRPEKPENISTTTSVKRLATATKSKTVMKKKNELSAAEEADNMANAILGSFEDIFDTQNIVQRDGHSYCIGNLILCYINLSYTNLEFPSVKRILEVLRYQNDLVKTPPATGLLKVAIEGNYIADASSELCNIDEYLRKAMTAHLPERNHVLRINPLTRSLSSAKI